MLSRLLSKVISAAPKSALLLGPRQVGKSTLIESLKPDLTINLNDEKTFLDFKSNPNELRELIEGQSPSLVFIDEIQRYPELLNTIQVILDSKKYKNKLKFFITGSSARKLKKGQANLLPGRIFSYQLGPLCAAELNYDLDVEKALRYGCLPEPYLHSDPAVIEKLLSTYAGIYLKEEIQAEALTRNLEGFSRFLMNAAANAGQAMDFSKISKKAKIERKNCARFFEILEDTLIAQRLEVFADTSADVIKRPKCYFFDTGVLNGLLENFNVSSDRIGVLFEHLVINQVLSSAKARDINIKTFYFRTRSGFEVDLILQIGKKTFAVEIKSGFVGAQEAQHLEKFSHYYKTDAFFVVSNQTQTKKIGNVMVCEISPFLKAIGL